MAQLKRVSILTLFSLLTSMAIYSQVIVNLQTKKKTTVFDKYKSEDVRLGIIENNQEAELWIYPAPHNETRTDRSVVICPGGGYRILAFDHEGVDVAKWFNEQGITAFVLKYRMPNGDKTIPLTDAYDAMLYVRANAKGMNIAADRVGVVGFSAGGHLAASLSNCIMGKADAVRPNFSILFYPVITMGDKGHRGSEENLFGKYASIEDMNKFSIELQITKDTPPTILLLSDDDKTVDPQNSTDYYAALKANNIPATMYVFPVGGHGWGIRQDFQYHGSTFHLLSQWLHALDK